MSSIILFFLFILVLASVLLVLNLMLARHNPYQDKDNPFECGYLSFLGQNRKQFSISFFIFGLLFLLFDLEILLVYPYVVSSHLNGLYGLILLIVFLLALTVGFVFEFGKKALNLYSKQNDNTVIYKKKHNWLLNIIGTQGEIKSMPESKLLLTTYTVTVDKLTNKITDIYWAIFFFKLDLDSMLKSCMVYATVRLNIPILAIYTFSFTICFIFGICLGNIMGEYLSLCSTICPSMRNDIQTFLNNYFDNMEASGQGSGTSSNSSSNSGSSSNSSSGNNNNNNNYRDCAVASSSTESGNNRNNGGNYESGNRSDSGDSSVTVTPDYYENRCQLARCQAVTDEIIDETLDKLGDAYEKKHHNEDKGRLSSSKLPDLDDNTRHLLEGDQQERNRLVEKCHKWAAKAMEEEAKHEGGRGFSDEDCADYIDEYLDNIFPREMGLDSWEDANLDDKTDSDKQDKQDKNNQDRKGKGRA